MGRRLRTCDPNAAPDACIGSRPVVNRHRGTWTLAPARLDPARPHHGLTTSASDGSRRISDLAFVGKLKEDLPWDGHLLISAGSELARPFHSGLVGTL